MPVELHPRTDSGRGIFVAHMVFSPPPDDWVASPVEHPICRAKFRVYTILLAFRCLSQNEIFLDVSVAVGIVVESGKGLGRRLPRYACVGMQGFYCYLVALAKQPLLIEYHCCRCIELVGASAVLD